MEQISEIVSIIQQNLPQDEKNLLTNKRLIPANHSYKEDLLVISNELDFLKLGVISEDQVEKTLSNLHFLMENDRDHSRYIQSLIKLLTKISSDELKETILTTVTSCSRGIEETIHFFTSLNNYLKTILLDQEMMFSSHTLIEEIQNSTYYSVLNPIFEIRDKFIPYLYFTEIGNLIIEKLSKIKDSLHPMKEYCEQILDIREYNTIFTSLDRKTIEVTGDLLLRYHDGSEEKERELSTFVELVAEYLNAKVWILLTALTALGQEPSKLNIDEILNDDYLKEFSLEYFTSPTFLLYTKFFEDHRKISWVNYDIDSKKSKGLIMYLSETIFSFLDHGIEIDTSILEGVFEVLHMPCMDWKAIRHDLIQLLIFSPFKLDQWLKDQITSVFSFQVERITEIGEDKFKKYILSGEVEPEQFQEFRFVDLLFEIMKEIEY